jgi:nicotinamide-nucleotide amidase
MLLDQIAERFQRFGAPMTENNRRQAMIPDGATPIENPVGTAPIFVLETERGVVMTLPGVPREMKHLLETELIPRLNRYVGTKAVIRSLVLRTAGIGESQIDARITDLMVMTNPTVGLAAHSGQTDIRITAKAPSDSEADALIDPIAKEITDRLGAWIYGIGDGTIEQSVVELLKDRGTTASILESGTSLRLRNRLQAADPTMGGLKTIIDIPSDQLTQSLATANSLDEWARKRATDLLNESGSDYAIIVVVHTKSADTSNHGTVVTVTGPHGIRSRTFGWSSERSDSDIWATTYALAMLRRAILKTAEPT